ncbi:unnamed protein product, partial [Polarella glacialis]
MEGSKFCLAFLAPLGAGSARDHSGLALEVRGLAQQLQERAAAALQQQFASSLRPLGDFSTSSTAGPVMSIGISSALPCTDAGVAEMHQAYMQAEDSLEASKEAELRDATAEGGRLRKDNEQLKETADELKSRYQALLAEKQQLAKAKFSKKEPSRSASAPSDEQALWQRMRSNGVSQHVAVLRSSASSAAALERAAAELRSLAKSSAENRAMLAKAGAVPLLVGLLAVGRGSAGAQEAAAGTLWILAQSDEIEIVRAGAIPAFVGLLSSGSRTAQEIGAAALRNLALEKGNNRWAIAEAGAIPPLVALLSGENSAVAREKAAGALGNLAGVANNKKAIAKAGAIPLLVVLLSSGISVAMQEVAASTLWSLAVDDNNKVEIVKAGAIAMLVALLSEGSAVAQEHCAGALSHLAVVAEHQKAIAEAGAIPQLV